MILKILNHYNQPEIVSMRMKLAQKVALCLRVSLALVAACRRSCHAYRITDLASWMSKVVSGMFMLSKWWGMERWAKVRVQNGVRAIV